MATNQTTVTVSRETTYVLPISYASLTMVSGVDPQEQLLIFRNNIDEVSGLTLSLQEYRGLGQIASDWLTLDEINKTITAITIPPGAVFTRDNGTTTPYPALQSGESISVRRVNIVAEPYVTWTTGSRITADQLNLNTNHLLGLIQELKVASENALLRTDTDAVLNPLKENLNAGSFKIENLATPTASQDAATKAYVDSAINTAVTSKLGAVGGIATLDFQGKLLTTQRPTSLGVLPSSFFAIASAPVRSTGGSGLFLYGSLWFNTTVGKLYVYIPDDNFPIQDPATDGEIGYWVDVAAPAQ